MWKKQRAPRDEGLQQIDDWERWFLGAQLATIAANGDMYPAERETSIAASKTLAVAVAEKMREEYGVRVGATR